MDGIDMSVAFLEDEPLRDESMSCPKCQTVMLLVTSLPKDGDLPEVRGFRCPQCGEVAIRECDLTSCGSMSCLCSATA